jgi:hypothetical protein
MTNRSISITDDHSPAFLLLQQISAQGMLRSTVDRELPSGDPCDFLSSSVKDLERILQGMTLFSWGNEEFLEETCNWEVSWILPGFETSFSSEDARLSILFESGSYSRCSEILVETCNWEVTRNLTRFETRLHHDPPGIFAKERHNLVRILMVSDANKSEFQDTSLQNSGFSQAAFRNSLGSCQDLIEILPGLLQDLNEETWKEWTHRVLIPRPSVYEPNSLPRWTVPYYCR